MVKQVVCRKCDEKCLLDIETVGEDIIVFGNNCSEGVKFARDEENNNSGTFTTLVRIKGARLNVLSVKSTKPIDRKLWIECSKALSRVYVGAPIRIGDIVCKNILNTGVDIVSTKNVDKNI